MRVGSFTVPARSLRQFAQGILVLLADALLGLQHPRKWGIEGREENPPSASTT
jgi:hypothetical protein